MAAESTMETEPVNSDGDGEEINRLSTLPEPLLVRILSCLPARDAARSCALKTFGDLWMSIDSLCFDDYPFMDDDKNNGRDASFDLKFLNFVTSFLLRHRNPEIREFRLTLSNTLEDLAASDGYDFGDEKLRRLQNNVESSIVLAVNKAVEVLELRFGTYRSGPIMPSFRLPQCVLTCKTLVDLCLFNCNIRHSRPAQMKSLRVLRLALVRLSTTNLKEIISGSPLLRSLTICDCTKLRGISFSAPNIETLNVSVGDKTWTPVINCPNVRHFHLSGRGDRVKVIDLSSTKTASLRLVIEVTRDNAGFDTVKGLLEKIQHVEIMEFNKEAFAVLTCVLIDHPFSFNKWKTIHIETWMNDYYISGIHSLLRYSSNLEELVLEFKDPSRDIPRGVTGVFHHSAYTGKNNFSEWLIHNLKKVIMRGLFKGVLVAQFDLAKVILKNALRLEEFVISAKGYFGPFNGDALTSEELLNISKDLISYPRACDQTVVFLT